MQTTLIQIDENSLNQLLERAAEVGAKKATELVGNITKEEFITEAQAMQLLNCQRNFLFSLRDRKLISYSRLSPRKVLYSRQSILQHIADNLRK